MIVLRIGSTLVKRIPSAALIGASLLVLTACGGQEEPADALAEATGGLRSACSAIAPPEAVDGPLTGQGVGGVLVSDGPEGPKGAPFVTVANDATPAADLAVLDLVPGSGAEAVPGGTLTVEYCGVGLESGAVFDSSWARGEPATFPLDGLIAGWQEGLPGMKVGGRRLLVIPGSLAYGANPPQGSGIAPDETLAFVIDLTAAQ